MRSKLVTLLLAGGFVVTGSTAGVIAAGDPGAPEGKSAAKTQYVDGKCNSGNGNKSDEVTWVEGAHCYGGDPGNSYKADNKGGDESTTTGGGNNSGTVNPGGNNDPGN